MSDKETSMIPAADAKEDEIGLLDIGIVLAKYKRLVVGLPIVAGIAAAVISLILPVYYTGITRILPPQGQSSMASQLLQSLGGLAGLAGGVAGIKSPNDLYIGMLKSRSVADNLIQRFDLNKLYDQEYQSNTRKELEYRTSILSGKDGIITIEVDDRDPKRAAEIANAYVEELYKLTKVLAVTEASQRRLFFERQFSEARDNLAAAEAAARQGLQSGGLVQVEGQGRALVETTARLRAQMSVKEIQIGAMRAFAAERNPDLQAAQQELAAMKAELARIEGTGSRSTGGSSAEKGAGLGNFSLLRNVKYYETMYELLARQYELAKIDEARDATVVQVMDKAIEPDRKSKPRRTIIVLITVLVAGLFSVFAAFILNAIDNAKRDPVAARRMELFRNLMRKR